LHYKLLGFSQNDSVRRFKFERILGDGTSSGAFTVVADLALARNFRIMLQELPSLCSRILKSRSDDQPAGTIVLTDADLEVLAAANVATAHEEEAKRLLRSRRSAFAAAARTIKNNGLTDSAVAGNVAVPEVIHE
jgi:hypothetical protein